MDDAKFEMMHFENTLTSLFLNELYKKIRRQVVNCYLRSPTKEIVQILISQQIESCLIDLASLELDDGEIQFAFLETVHLPYTLKHFYPNLIAELDLLRILYPKIFTRI